MDAVMKLSMTSHSTRVSIRQVSAMGMAPVDTLMVMSTKANGKMVSSMAMDERFTLTAHVLRGHLKMAYLTAMVLQLLPMGINMKVSGSVERGVEKGYLRG